MSQKLPVDGFKWIENISQFNEIFIKNYNQDSNVEHFLKVDVKIYKHYINYPMIYNFYQNEEKSKSVKTFLKLV